MSSNLFSDKNVNNLRIGLLFKISKHAHISCYLVFLKYNQIYKTGFIIADLSFVLKTWFLFYLLADF